MEVLDAEGDASPDAGGRTEGEQDRQERKDEKKSGGFWSRLTKR
jgi:hypothetical protein